MKEGARAPGRAIRHLEERNLPRRHLGGHLVEVVEHAVIYASRSKTPGVVLFCSFFFTRKCTAVRVTVFHGQGSEKRKKTHRAETARSTRRDAT